MSYPRNDGDHERAWRPPPPPYDRPDHAQDAGSPRPAQSTRPASQKAPTPTNVPALLSAIASGKVLS